MSSEPEDVIAEMQAGPPIVVDESNFWLQDRTREIELGGVAEISAEFGVPRTTISMWNSDIRRTNSGFPEPVARLAAGPVFDMAEVRAWFSGREEQP